MCAEKLQPRISVIKACMGTIQRARVGVISTGRGPQTSLRLLILTCQEAGFISHCPDDGGALVKDIAQTGRVSSQISR